MKYMVFTLPLMLVAIGCSSAKKEDKSEIPAPAQEVKVEKSENKKAISCDLKEDHREIANRETQSKGCEVLYTKFGQSQQVANAQHQLEICEEVAGRIKSNLEKAGFACSSNTLAQMQ